LKNITKKKIKGINLLIYRDQDEEDRRKKYVSDSKINMRHFLTAQTMNKKRNLLQEKEDNKVYTNIWKQDLVHQLEQEKENNDRVTYIIKKIDKAD